MTLPWSKMPRALRGDWRLTQRSPEAIAAFFLAWLAADDDGSIGPAGSTPAVEALAAQLSTHRPGDPLGWAVEAVAECLDAGLLESLDDGDALRVVDWLDAPAQPSQGPQPSPEGDRPTAEKRPPGRPRSASPMSASERQQHKRFVKRLYGFRDVPADVTWEQWKAANHVTETLGGCHGNSAAVTETPVDCHGNPVTKTRVEGRTSDPEDQKDAENKGEGESGARPPRHGNPVTKTTAVTETQGASFRDSARCSTVESLAPFDADASLSRMGTASGGRLSPAATATQMQAFGAIARELIARGHVTADGLVKAAGHAPHVPWITRLSGPLTVQRLCADEGRVLVELISGAGACKACGGDPLASGVIELPAPPRPAPPPVARVIGVPVANPASREDVRAALAGVRALSAAKAAPSAHDHDPPGAAHASR